MWVNTWACRVAPPGGRGGEQGECWECMSMQRGMMGMLVTGARHGRVWAYTCGDGCRNAAHYGARLVGARRWQRPLGFSSFGSEMQTTARYHSLISMLCLRWIWMFGDPSVSASSSGIQMMRGRWWLPLIIPLLAVSSILLKLVISIKKSIKKSVKWLFVVQPVIQKANSHSVISPIAEAFSPLAFTLCLSMWECSRTRFLHHTSDYWTILRVRTQENCLRWQSGDVWSQDVKAASVSRCTPLVVSSSGFLSVRKMRQVVNHSLSRCSSQ